MLWPTREQLERDESIVFLVFLVFCLVQAVR